MHAYEKTMYHPLSITHRKGNRFMKEEFDLNIEVLEEKVAPTIVALNGGGNTPNGQANGVPNGNPAGYYPPGQNK